MGDGCGAHVDDWKATTANGAMSNTGKSESLKCKVVYKDSARTAQ